MERSVSEEKRKEFQREQERLLLKMERKGEQISKLYKHKSQVGFHKATFLQMRFSLISHLLLVFSFLLQVKKLRKRVSSRGYSPGAIKCQPGERSKKNLVLLRDMKALQASLRT